MNEELINAVRRNNIDRVSELVVEEGVDINKQDSGGQTPLGTAVSLDNIDMVRFLVKELGADINKYSRGQTPLINAIFSGKINMVRFLVKELGADINKQNIYGITPFQNAISYGRIDIVKLLVKELGVNIDQEDTDGNTPLIRALLEKKLFILDTLIELGADVNKKNKYGNTAYLYARCKPDILELLKKAGAIVEDFEEENKLLYLTHKTTLNNLSKILESEKIYTDVDMWYRNTINLGFAGEANNWKPSSITSSYVDKYPGVYMTLINNELVGNKIGFTNIVPICLVFCISLLDKENFHSNHDWLYGQLYSEWTKFNITELQNSIKKDCNTLRNEIVFHNSISLKYLKEIWVGDEKTYSEVKDMLKKTSMDIPVQVTNNYLDETRTCVKKIEKQPSNYCYFPSHAGEFENYNKEKELKFAKKLGKECGLTDIDDIDDPEIIRKLLEKEIFSDDVTIEGIKEYLKNKGVSDDTIENLSENQLKELKDMNLVGLNFLKNYSRFDGGKGKRRKSRSKRKKSRRKSGRKKSRSKRRKSGKNKSKSKRRKLGRK